MNYEIATEINVNHPKPAFGDFQGQSKNVAEALTKAVTEGKITKEQAEVTARGYVM